MTDLSNLLPMASPALSPGGSLADAARGAAHDQAREVAAQFESVFVSMMIKEMRQTLEGDGLFGGEASDTYGGLFDLYMGEHIAQGGGLGVGEMVERYLQTMQDS